MRKYKQTECVTCGKPFTLKPRPGVSRSHPQCGVCAFWSLVDKTSSSCGCWLWAGSLTRGYGKLRLREVKSTGKVFAHRAAWILTNGPIQDDLCVLHCCEGLYPKGDITNRRCVNPEHLRLGTQKENVADCFATGKRFCPTGIEHRAIHPLESITCGVNHKNAKLNDDVVRDIRSSAEPSRKIAKRLGVNKITVLRVRNGKTWRHVT